MISNIDEQGFWIVDNQKFQYKYPAVLYASQLGKEANDVKYNFHDELFDHYDWTTPTSKSLNQLYKEHALRLREKYDYLVLHYSSGPDSHNILETFAFNNIHLDEVVIRGSNLDRLNANSYNPTDVDAETFVRALPLAKLYKEKYLPHLKITFVDIQDAVIDWWTKNNNVVEKTGEFITDPNQVVRYDNNRYLASSNTAGKKVGHIFGHDKPILRKDDIGYYTVFSDVNQFKYFKNPINSDRQDYYVEFFYWNKHTAELVINQCHILLNAIFQTQNLNYFDDYILDPITWRKTDDFIASVIYNRQHDIPVILSKPINTFIAANGWWFQQDKTSTYYKNYAKHFWEWKKNLHPSFLYSGDLTRNHSKKRYIKLHTV